MGSKLEPQNLHFEGPNWSGLQDPFSTYIITPLPRVLPRWGTAPQGAPGTSWDPGGGQTWTPGTLAPMGPLDPWDPWTHGTLTIDTKVDVFPSKKVVQRVLYSF